MLNMKIRLPFQTKIQQICNTLRIVMGSEQKDANFEQLRKLPRFQPVEFKFFSKKLKIIDSASFLFQYGEIFTSEIYKFKARNQHPYIIDCGANIGLSIIYFKKLYPQATIIAFEPDPMVFSVLSYNIRSFGFSDVTLINKALWDKATALPFFSEGSDGGRVAVQGDNKQLVRVKTERLNKYLRKPIDFLKIDIEGAETRVLQDCQEQLANVRNLFVEYHSFVKTTQTLDALLAILRTCSFRYYVSHIGTTSPHPFIQKSVWVGMDNQLNIYATKD